MAVSKNKSDVEQLTGIFGQFERSTIIEAVRRLDLDAALTATPRGVTEGDISQSCGAEEAEPYWEAIGARVDGTISVTNTGPCTIQMTVEYGSNDVTRTVRHGQTKAISSALLKSLKIECGGSAEAGQCLGSWRLST